MISLGVQFGGPEHSASIINRSLITAARIAVSVRDQEYKSLNEGWINPIYIVPGTVSKPDFEGCKLGHFSKKDKGLVVAIAVPQSVADGEEINSFIGLSLRNAAHIAAEYFKCNKISFSTLKAEKIILSIEAELQRMVA
ncbi:hypothetical protein [Amaricoccus sp.]|uniref:hypothetical protein n=1 Tax=Amaricoccus sp. TaxID=1872485 RepID=UPI001B71B11C|nr:hypothetical protein [Amaricoccus sp.]MBP7002074.1 hypothetical protein [Amaricoccus sp.]